MGACGGSSDAAKSSAPASTDVASAHAPQPALLEWPEYGLNPQRTNATSQATGITAANVAHLRHQQVTLPGTVDSSPIYVHAATVAGATHNVIVVTTTYGKTLAIDADSGRILWTFTPPGYGGFAGSAQITNAAPLADPDHRFVYAVSPNGLIHKLALENGTEDRAGAWPVSITRDATHEKVAPALNIDGSYVIVTTGGYIGDTPPYQGHVVAIDRESGHIAAVFNTLCASRHSLIVPSSCHSSDSAIWSRAGAVVEPGGKRIVVVTGNAPWNGTTDFGDSAVELTFPGLRFRQAFTPSNQQQLNENDGDLGSGGPALLSAHQVLIGGKDGLLRVLDLAHMDGHAPSASREVLGGEAQTVSLPGGGELLDDTRGVAPRRPHDRFRGRRKRHERVRGAKRPTAWDLGKRQRRNEPRARGRAALRLRPRRRHQRLPTVLPASDHEAARVIGALEQPDRRRRARGRARGQRERPFAAGDARDLLGVLARAP